jgi:hypothetical protein
MRRWHFYTMGTIACLWGALLAAQYVVISYQIGWIDAYPVEQQRWWQVIPDWVHGAMGIWASLTLVGALCLIAHVRASVWMLGLAFISQLVLTAWIVTLATPTLQEFTGWRGIAAAALLLVLGAVLWLYARGEKRRGEVL